MRTGRIIAIGDVHGCAHALDALVSAISPAVADTLVFLGDLIDQGPETREVLERVIYLQARCNVVLIQGNHEEMLYAARESAAAQRYWENCGGALTIDSYHFGGTMRDIPEKHWTLLDQCRPYYETDDYIFTHANFLPDEPMELQPGHQLRWAMFEPGKEQPHLSGKRVFVGHTEQRSGEVLDLGFAVCLDTACWKYGWLTALDVRTKHVWQPSKWGLMREPGEAGRRERLSEVLGIRRPKGSR